MAKRRRSRQRKQTQRQRPANTPAIRKPAKLRAKIRLRPAIASPPQQVSLPIPPEPNEMEFPEIRPVNRLAGPAPSPLSLAPTAANLPKTRTDLGSRLPVFQPIVHHDPEPTWEEDLAAPTRVSTSNGRILLTGLTLALLATLVASLAMRPAIRETESLSSEAPPVPAAPITLLEKFDQLLRPPSVEARQQLVTQPDRIRDALTPPWAPEDSLTHAPSNYDATTGKLTVWLNPMFPVSVYVEDDRFDWQSLVGLGELSLSEFFLTRPEHDVELRVLAKLIAPGSSPAHLPSTEYERVRLSDLEGMVNGIAYIHRDRLPDYRHLSLTEPRPITVRAAYVDSETPDIKVPLLKTWVADDWRSRSPEA